MGHRTHESLNLGKSINLKKVTSVDPRPPKSRRLGIRVGLRIGRRGFYENNSGCVAVFGQVSGPARNRGYIAFFLQVCQVLAGVANAGIRRHALQTRARWGSFWPGWKTGVHDQKMSVRKSIRTQVTALKTYF